MRNRNSSSSKLFAPHSLNMSNRQDSKNLPTIGSLVKSKDIASKITKKLNQFHVPEANSFLKKQIQVTTADINQHLQNKIEHNFNTLLHSEKVLNIAEVQKATENIGMYCQKENFVPNAISAVQGSKILMNEYWQKQPQTNDSNAQQTPKLLSRIHQLAHPIASPKTKKVVLHNLITNYEKQREQAKPKPINQELTANCFAFNAKVLDYRVQNQSTDFLTFQRLNFKRWEDIQFVLICIEKFAAHYKIKRGQISLQRVLELVEEQEKKAQLSLNSSQNNGSVKHNQMSQNEKISANSNIVTYTVHQLLGCFEYAEQISQKNSKSKGIRFFGEGGKIRAIIKIQSQIRRFLCMKKFKHLKEIMTKVLRIQGKWKALLSHRRTQKQILETQLSKLKGFKESQKTFCQNYQTNEYTKKVKYEIHICSIESTEWQRVTTENPNQRTNMEISRVFRIASRKSHLIETRVIFITPCQLPQDIINYYNKIFEFGSQNENEDASLCQKLHFLFPEGVENLPQSLSLCQKIYYSPQLLKKIKRLIKNNYSYIVPSAPSNNFINLCHELKVPLYSSSPQQLLHLQTKSGTKAFIEETLNRSEQELDDTFGVLPYSSNLYNLTSFVNELSFLIVNYPTVRRWVLKIDDEQRSRGLAYFDASKVIRPELIISLVEFQNTVSSTHISYSRQVSKLKEEVHDILYRSIVLYKQERIVPLNSEIYPSQRAYLNHFLAYGGIIEASINNFESDLENHCFVIEIEPNSEWKFITSFYKLTNKNKAVGCYFDNTRQMVPPVQIQTMVKGLLKKKMFGFFVFEFLKIKGSGEGGFGNDSHGNLSNSNPTPKKQNLMYFNSIKCHLNELASAAFLKDFLSKDTNVLYIPKIDHPSLKELRLQTFFHLCRLQNISFDIQRKIGNVFMFLNGLEVGSMGVMTFNSSSKTQTYQQASDVMDFLNSKLSSGESKKLPKSFFAIRNAINGHLKRDKNKKISSDMKRGILGSSQSLAYISSK